MVDRRAAQVSGMLHTQVINEDFFRAYMGDTISGDDNNAIKFQRESFDLIIGNPPFGGTFDHSIEDRLDKIFGKRLGRKIKKETYAFFIVASIDLLKPAGQLVFLCSNTLMTISTMAGLRNFLMESGEVYIEDIQKFSQETTNPMLLLRFRKGGALGKVVRNSDIVTTDIIRSTPNLSWGVTNELARLFDGPLLGDFFVASSGMTTGKNEYFVREAKEGKYIVEPYRFEFHHAPVTVSYEIERARLGKISAKRRRELEVAESEGRTERRVNVLLREEPEIIPLPDSRYCPYNNAMNRPIFSEPTHYIYWEDEGDAVLTYKKTGNWYLRGVGGQPYFGKEGLTWPLVASKFCARYLPAGYILDSGAPCAFLRDGVDRDELFFVLAWLLSPLANRVLKNVINHTRNIQSKDFERMPYPWWVKHANRNAIVERTKSMIEMSRCGKHWNSEDEELKRLGDLFELDCQVNEGLIGISPLPTVSNTPSSQLTLTEFSVQT